MNRAEEAAAFMKQGHGSCAQSVLGAFADQLGLKPDAAMRLAHGLGAGLGRSGATCGAVNAAAIVIGAMYPETAEARAHHEAVYAAVREFVRRFTERYGSINCTGLLGCDISTSQGRDEARNKGLYTSFCPGLVASAVELAEEILAEVGGDRAQCPLPLRQRQEVQEMLRPGRAPGGK